MSISTSLIVSVSTSLCERVNFKFEAMEGSLTAWKVSVFEVFLVGTFPHLAWIRSICPYSVRIREIRTRETPSTGNFFAVCLFEKSLFMTEWKDFIKSFLRIIIWPNDGNHTCLDYHCQDCLPTNPANCSM